MIVTKKFSTWPDKHLSKVASSQALAEGQLVCFVSLLEESAQGVQHIEVEQSYQGSRLCNEEVVKGLQPKHMVRLPTFGS